MMSSDDVPQVVGIGAANVDVSGKSLNNLIARDSNPGHISISAGGVTRNILDNLARLGVGTALVSAVGEDAFGHVILESCDNAGIDRRHLLTVSGASSCYLNILDAGGDMALAVSDMRIIRCLSADFLDSKRCFIEGSDAVVIDGCLRPDAIIPLVFDICRDVPVFADTVSTAYARTIRSVMSGCHTLKPNIAELEILAEQPVRSDAELERAAEKVLKSGCFRVVVTLGSRGCYSADAEGTRMFRKLRTIGSVENATGAGDAFMAGLIYGTLTDMPVEEMLDFALAAGIIGVSSVSTINPAMSREAVLNTIEQYRE